MPSYMCGKFTFLLLLIFVIVDDILLLLIRLFMDKGVGVLGGTIDFLTLGMQKDFYLQC